MAPARHVGRTMSMVAAALLLVVAGCATEIAPSALPSTQVPTMTLELAATGLGPCDGPWYRTCNYGIRVEGPNGDDHRGTFTWDEGQPPPGSEGHGPNGPVASTGVVGDVPATLGPGEWTLSFRLWYGSDYIQLVPVPGGTPRTREEDPFTSACATTVNATGASKLTLHVAFSGMACTVESQSK